MECIYYDGGSDECAEAFSHCESCGSGPCCESCYELYHMVERSGDKDDECVKCTRIASERMITDSMLFDFLLMEDIENHPSNTSTEDDLIKRTMKQRVKERFKKHMLDTGNLIRDPRCYLCGEEGCARQNDDECCVCYPDVEPCDYCRVRRAEEKNK